MSGSGIGSGPGPVSLRANSVRNGSTLPATPAVGDVFEKTGSSAGLYACSSAGVWSGPFSTSSGITNSAPANTVTKSNGTNLVASRITDDGTDIAVVSGAGKTTIGDVGALVGNGTTFTVDDATSTISNDENSLFKLSGVLPLTAGGGSVGNSATPFNSVTIGTSTNIGTQLRSNSATASRTADFPDASGVIQFVGAANTGAPLTCLSNNTVLAQATGTVYTSPGSSGTPLSATVEDTVGWVAPRAGTIRNLYVRTGNTSKINSPTTTIVIRKNGITTTVTLVMTETVTTTTADTTHSFTVAAGDVITVSLSVAGAAAVSTSITSIVFELD